MGKNIQCNISCQQGGQKSEINALNKPLKESSSYIYSKLYIKKTNDLFSGRNICFKHMLSRITAFYSIKYATLHPQKKNYPPP